jgi:hypothetical protein
LGWIEQSGCIRLAKPLLILIARLDLVGARRSQPVPLLIIGQQSRHPLGEG